MEKIQTEVRGRYAPSPTGPLHLGNLRTALLSWLHVRLQNGVLQLRFDDLDGPRNKAGAVDQIIFDLHWLGLDFDGEIVFQSQRSQIYQQAFDTLQTSGHLFPCRCSRKDIQLALSAPDAVTPGDAYPGTCRPDASPVADATVETLAWRFLVDDTDIEFNDQIYGLQHSNLKQYPGDFVVKRKDGIFAYQLASVVDDAVFGITDVVRGEDLLDSTARQIALFDALEFKLPRFWHVPLMTDEEDNKLAKRDGTHSLDLYRNKGISAETLVGTLAASLGMVESGQRISCNELLQQSSIEGLQQSLKRAIVPD